MKKRHVVGTYDQKEAIAAIVNLRHLEYITG